MEVYHASSVIVDSPDVVHSRAFLDFGKGFYMTTIREQAEKYALRFLRRNKEAWLNIYELDEAYLAYRVKTFTEYNEEWLDFVAQCRTGRDVENYDIIMGGIANDKVFRTIDLFFAGDITRETALKRLVFEKVNHQICISNQEVIDRCLTYKSSIRL